MAHLRCFLGMPDAVSPFAAMHPKEAASGRFCRWFKEIGDCETDISKAHETYPHAGDALAL